jgi:hypothetical protein
MGTAAERARAIATPNVPEQPPSTAWDRTFVVFVNIERLLPGLVAFDVVLDDNVVYLPFGEM